ncbi:MAG: hypothetical protein DI556_20190 [Rhodovulum sulfidophilum]|uniref:Xylose isomerase-like TIM barrel domain-containing protein n=1 Tax=Rhodovulum sulfidophilum TaxID=35806 RepID=A0A2W5MYR6_RHOSU|nr:MAG: hypothetical protein DI556_20190 [Rhodovulum sulfidophilum]
MRSISMSYLTAPAADPFEALRIAAEAGYDGLGLRLCDPATGAPVSPLVTEPALRRRFLAELAARGLAVTEVEARVLAEAGAPVGAAVLETAAALGGAGPAPDLIAVGGPRGGPSDGTGLAEIGERFAALCEAAASHGVAVGFEPIAHRAAGSLAEALAVVAAGRGFGARLVLDALHVDRMGVTPAELAALDPGLLRVLHLCDAPPAPADLETMIDHSARNRLPPGQGDLALGAYLAALPAELPLALEIPMTRLDGRVSLERRARVALDCARAVLAGEIWKPAGWPETEGDLRE